MTSAFTAYASLVLLDVPGTLLVVVAALLVERATRRGSVDWWPALVLPVVCMAAVYTRFGTTTNLAAAILAVLVARADLLLAAGRRAQTLLRLAVVGGGSAVLSGVVLLVPQMTGSRTAPFRLQQVRQDAKGISIWASYGDMFDLFWPNGSRPGETFTWFALVVVVLGAGLTGLAAFRGRYRRAAVAGVVSVVVWAIGLNYALAQLFGNYIGLGAPFFALLAAPGWAYAFEVLAHSDRRRRAAVLVGATAAVVGSALGLHAGSDQVEPQRSQEQFRSAGVALGEITPDQHCGVMTSYVQIAWYSDCILANFSQLHVGYYADRNPQIRGVFDLDQVEPDQIYYVLVEKGKRQPTGEILDELLGDGEFVFGITEVKYPISVYRVIDLGSAPPPVPLDASNGG